MADDDLHVLPVNDSDEHIEAIWCPCKPRVETADPATFVPYKHRMVVHNSWDGREHREPDHDKENCDVCQAN